MPPKRKASASGRGGGATKRLASTAGTPQPQSIGSSDEFTEDGEYAAGSDLEGPTPKEERRRVSNMKHAIKAMSAENLKRGGKGSSNEVTGGTNNLSNLKLKPDHERRPLWVDPERDKIILENFSPFASRAKDFLTTIAEPLSRPAHLHEYKLTSNSLYAAISVGLEPEDIVETLEKFSKTVLPTATRNLIINSSKQYGKLKKVLKNSKYYLETPDNSILQKLVQDEVISAHLVSSSKDIITEKAVKKGPTLIPGTREAAGVVQQIDRQDGALPDTGRPEQDVNTEMAKDDEMFLATLREEDDDEDEDQKHIHSVEIQRDSASLERVIERCWAMDYPVLEEYDHENDDKNATLDINTRPNTRLRDYQETSLRKMFGNSRARSGMIVLPCGAGKTLVGVAAACTIKKGTLVLCTSSMSVVQWRQEFIKWSNIDPDDIAIFTAESKTKFSRSTGIIVSTYSMVTQSRSRSYDAQKMMDFMTEREWGLMILDEVHVVPASIFRKVTGQLYTHCKLGLTATLLREDDKISDLNLLVGPKLYEANWMELSEQGHIAKVQCAEVWCPMTTEFYQEYLREKSRKRGLLYVMNPRKFQACQFLINYHEKRGDKTIVFSDNVYALESYAKKLGKFYIFGGTNQSERMRVLENFQHSSDVNTIFLSKIGDTSLDLPEATCLIQISSHYGSRRQEAQRLGRILRAKRRNDEGFNAFFYSLVSKDTQEMYYSAKRQAFLVDQGYAFKVISHLNGLESLPGLAYATSAERRELLQDVMLQNEEKWGVEDIKDDLFSVRSNQPKGKNSALAKKGAKRTAGLLSDLSGGQDMVGTLLPLRLMSTY